MITKKTIMFPYFKVLFSVFVLLSSVCTGRVKRIINGRPVGRGENIRITSLRNSTNNEHLCGSILISPDYALTAAHCLRVDRKQKYSLVLSNHNFTCHLQPFEVREIHIHPQFDIFTGAHDIAVLKIDNHNLTNENLLAYLQTDILPKRRFGFALSGICYIYGYGLLKPKSNFKFNTLHVGQVKITSLDQCIKKLGPFVAPKPGSGMFCATGEGVDACQGDSGGPMICEERVEGLVSYGLDCGLPDMPGVYTGVAAHVDWIRSVMNEIYN